MAVQGWILGQKEMAAQKENVRLVELSWICNIHITHSCFEINPVVSLAMKQNALFA
jgi:hypothetical protein